VLPSGEPQRIQKTSWRKTGLPIGLTDETGCLNSGEQEQHSVHRSL
jgi:hypothetical protein